MIKHWKTRKINNLSEFLILNKESIWIAKIDENEISIDNAIKEKKLFGKTAFYRFSELENIVFDEDSFKIKLNFLADEDGQKENAIKIDIKKTDYTDLKNHIIQIFPNKPFKDLSFFDKEKPLIFTLLSTIGIGVALIFTIGLSLKTIGLLLVLTIVEIIVIKGVIKTPKNGKILKLN